MSKINGTSLIVKLGGVVIGSSTSCTLNLNQDLPSVANKGSQGWDEVIAGAKDWSVDCDGLVDFADTLNMGDLAGGLIAGTQYVLEFTTSTTGHDYFYGNVLIASISATADTEQPVTFSASFKGNGILNKGTVTASA